MPNFDQWLNPAIEAPVSSQKVPAIIDDELDAELTMGDPDPTTPFFMFVHAGYRRLGEVGHYVRKRTKGLARVVSIDTKRRSVTLTSSGESSTIVMSRGETPVDNHPKKPKNRLADYHPS